MSLLAVFDERFNVYQTRVPLETWECFYLDLQYLDVATSRCKRDSVIYDSQASNVLLERANSSLIHYLIENNQFVYRTDQLREKDN